MRVAMKSLGSPVMGDRAYAAAADAKEEDRAYLHSAAVRVPPFSGGPPIQVVAPPVEGADFVAPGFEAAWRELFPDGVTEDTGVWFPDEKDKLVSSEPIT